MKTEYISLEEFERDKARNISEIETRISMIKAGTMLQATELELQIARRMTYEGSKKDRRFITN